MSILPRPYVENRLFYLHPVLIAVGVMLATLPTPILLASAEDPERGIGEILREGGYREDFAGAAYMNKFALAFRLVNNIVCGRCNATEKETGCLPKFEKLKDSNGICDNEEAYYDTGIDHELDIFLPCLLRDSDESTMLCLMETPMGVPLPEKVDAEEDGTQTSATDAGHASAMNGSDEAKKPLVPLRTQEIVDIVSDAKITRVIIGEQLSDSVPGRHRTLVHDKHHRRLPDTKEQTNTTEKEWRK
ncbi:uncharacterized protein LOC144123171 [Amblyomma americanum]